MKVDVLSVEGRKVKEIELPKRFEAEVDKGLLKRAVLAIQSNARHPQGTMPRAGRENTAKYRGKRSLPTNERGINVGRARLPRLNNRRGRLQGRVAGIPRAVGGPRAHPPKAEANKKQKINKKEKKAALNAGIAATADLKLVGKRHVLDKSLKLPLVVENSFEGIEKTKELSKALAALKVLDDVKNAKEKTRRRAGKGKKRGRKKKQKISILLVTGKTAPVFKAARNLPGVEVCVARNLNAELLAPGCEPGRLALWSESAIDEIDSAGKGGEKQ
jgi:large subunit ribosomal protein L4e